MHAIGDVVSNVRRRRDPIRHTLAATLVAGLTLVISPAAHAAVISSGVTCVMTTCTVEPNGGPVAVDPLGFTLDIEWQPQVIELLGVIDAGDWWALRFVFDFTGIHDGTESWGVVTLQDHLGAPVAGLNPQFDDSNVVGNTLTVNYQIFNAGLDFQNYFLHGLHLALSDGSGVDTMQWVSAAFSPAAVGIRQVPEPALLLVLGVGLAAAGVRRRLGHRRG